ncbi:adenine phosphoribosyltransferase [Onthophagus taurus]|uniref:adenine phosphoribosyltransferase n=1 Tax=Onthophagus taurus TaxID=166361 RepID=UPI000C206A8A|nr:adenine phosphoribosyltransferase [Onthophagus taurus]
MASSNSTIFSNVDETSCAASAGPAMKETEIAEHIQLIAKCIKSYPDFPKQGVLFRDVFSILREPKVFPVLRDVLVALTKKLNPIPECIAALDARGFLFGPLIALELKVPFIPIRKKGKLPGEVISQTYTLEYGTDCLEIQKESITKGVNVLVVDDLLATGGSMKAAIDLLEKAGAEVIGCLIIVEIMELNGRGKLTKPVIPIVQY